VFLPWVLTKAPAAPCTSTYSLALKVAANTVNLHERQLSNQNCAAGIGASYVLGTIGYPGVGDFTQENGWNDAMESFLCTASG